jgi:hypothetical protein
VRVKVLIINGPHKHERGMAETYDNGDYIVRSPLPGVVPPMVHVDLIDCPHSVKACLCSPSGISKEAPDAH